MKDEVEIKWQLKEVTRKVEAIALNKLVNVADAYQVDGCLLCASPMYLYSEFPISITTTKNLTEQVNAFNKYMKSTCGPFAETYNPGQHNHPNFSWK